MSDKGDLSVESDRSGGQSSKETTSKRKKKELPIYVASFCFSMQH